MRCNEQEEVNPPARCAVPAPRHNFANKRGIMAKGKGRVKGNSRRGYGTKPGFRSGRKLTKGEIESRRANLLQALQIEYVLTHYIQKSNTNRVRIFKAMYHSFVYSEIEERRPTLSMVIEQLNDVRWEFMWRMDRPIGT